MKIQLKRSNVLDGGSAKKPTAQQMEFGELAVNYNAADPTIFIKDDNGVIIPIAGDSHILNLIQENQQIIVSPTPPTTPPPVVGDLWLDMSQCPPELNVWSDCDTAGGEWLPIGGTPELTVATPSLSAADLFIGTTLTCSEGNAIGGKPDYTYSYIFSNDVTRAVVQDSASNTYTTTEADFGTSISAVVRAIDSRGTIALSDSSNTLGPIGSNLTVGKGQISPNIDVEEGDTLTGSATVANAFNPVETHVWELDGSEDQRGSSATYTAKAGVVRYRKEVTDDYATEIGEWSDPVTVEANSGPNADMHGLRFDSARTTYLSRTPASPGNRKTWTWSGWYKRTSIDDNLSDSLFSAAGTNDSTLLNLIFLNSKIYVAGSTSPWRQTSAQFKDVSRWMHIVLSVDTTQTDENNRILLYVDGQKITSFDQSNNPALNANLGVNDSSVHTIGKYLATHLDGYLSDVYFVDGQALEPEAFGKDFDGKWGPLDSSEVINMIQPPNQATSYQVSVTDDLTQSWSDISAAAQTASVGSPPAVNEAGHGLYFFVDEGKSYVIGEGGNGNPTWSGGNTRVDVSSDGINWTTHYTPPSGTPGINNVPLITEPYSRIVVLNPNGNLNQLQTDYFYARTKSFGANGFFLPFDPAATGQIWSNTVTFSYGNGGTDLYQADIANRTATATTNGGAKAAFTGDIDSYTYYDGNTDQGGGYAYFNPATPITNVTSLRFRNEFFAGARVNGTAVTISPASADGPIQWVTVQNPPSTLNELAIRARGGTGAGATAARIGAIEVNGEILIDHSSIGADASGNNNHFSDENFNSKVSVPTGQLQSQDFSDNKLTGDVQGAEWQRTIEKFYGGAADFTDLNNPQAIQLPDTDAFVVGSGDFTISAWQYIPSLTHAGGEIAYMFDVGTESSNSRLSITRSSGGSYSASVGGQVVSGILVASDLIENQWQYVTFVRTGGNLNSYVDGVLKQTKPCTGSIANRPPAGNEPAIGHTKIKNLSKIYNWKGYLQDFTIHKKALYTSNFTPPDYSMVDLETGDLDRRVDKDALALAVALNDFEYNPEYYNSGSDTVLDTPMKNYAVLDKGKNGNLEATANTEFKSTLPVTGKVYAEIAVIDDNLSDHIALKNSGGTNLTTFGADNYIPGDLAAVTVDIETGDHEFYVNNVSIQTGTVDTSGGVYIGGFNTAADGGFTFNFGQQPWVYGPPAGYEGLYQTWEQWARTALGYALDRITKLEGENSQLREQVQQALTRITVIEADEISDDATSANLVTLVNDLLSRVEALEA